MKWDDHNERDIEHYGDPVVNISLDRQNTGIQLFNLNRFILYLELHSSNSLIVIFTQFSQTVNMINNIEFLYNNRSVSMYRKLVLYTQLIIRGNR